MRGHPGQFFLQRDLNEWELQERNGMNQKLANLISLNWLCCFFCNGRQWNMYLFAKYSIHNCCLCCSSYPPGCSLSVSGTSLMFLGLNSLTEILNGRIFVGKNRNLCYVNSVNWSSITAMRVKLLENGNETICGQSAVSFCLLFMFHLITFLILLDYSVCTRSIFFKKIIWNQV